MTFNDFTPSQKIDARPTWLPALVLLAGLGLGFLSLALFFSTPETVLAGSDETAFSAERAWKHLPFMASAPRPVGSSGNKQTREYLLAELREMGLDPEIQEASSLLRFEGSPGFSAGYVRNVIVRIPGTNGAAAIALDAHYDGAATGPAAADCGSGVIVLLETIRAILAGPPLENDLIFVFADAEEVGDLGAHAFASRHPWMHNVRLAFNYEAMGTGGPAYLYVVSEGSQPLIRRYRRADPSTRTNSFTTGIFGLFPGQRLACDLQDYMDEGSAGLGFVFTGNISAYHTKLDNIENLDPRTVQQLGESTLRLLRYFGNQKLENLKGAEDGVFFSLWPGALIQYPASASLPLSLAGLVLLLAAVGWNVRLRRLSAGRVTLATLAFLLGSLLATVVTAGLWYGIKSMNGNLGAFLIGNWAVQWQLAGILLLAATLVTIFAAWLRKRLPFAAQLAGGLLGMALLAVLLGAVYPVGNYPFLWPVWLGALALSGVLADKPTAGHFWRTAAAVLGLVLSLLLLFGPIMAGPNPFTGLLIRLDALTGLPLLAVDAFFAAVLAGILVPLIAIYAHCPGCPRRLSWLGLGLTALAFTIGWAKSGFDADHPHPETIRYEWNATEGRALWVSGDHRLGDWTGRFIPSDTPPVSEANPSLLEDWPTTYVAPAPEIPLSPPAVGVLADRREAGVRKLHVRLYSPRQASMLRVRIAADDALLSASLAGEPFELDDYDRASQGSLWFNYAAIPPRGVELTLTVEGVGLVHFSLVDLKDGLPEGLEHSRRDRPETTMPSPLSADCTVAGIELEI